jgi:hypothetical protein
VPILVFLRRLDRVIRANLTPHRCKSPENGAATLSLNVSEMWQARVAPSRVFGLHPGSSQPRTGVSGAATLRCVARLDWGPARYFSPYPGGNPPRIEELFREAGQSGVSFCSLPVIRSTVGGTICG